MSRNLLISDAAKEVNVESHVLRYWEEELHLPIKRNELGHRYYTEEDVERFKQIKGMKERGLQLKAIKMILKDGKLDVLSGGMILPDEREMSFSKQGMGDVEDESFTKQEMDSEADEISQKESATMAIQIVERHENGYGNESEYGSVGISKQDKSYRLQLLLRQLILETVKENNQELCRQIKESVVKELDYQFRVQEEREEERERRQVERNEEYYKRMDELLRRKTLRLGGKKKTTEEKNTVGEAVKRKEVSRKEKKIVEEKSKITPISDKKKRHFLF